MGASDFVNLPNIGTSVRRKEDYRFLTGGGQYTDDINIAGQTYAVFVRSPHAHARIKSINIKAAQAAAGVVDVLVGKDVADAKIGGLPCGWLITSTDGQPMKEPPHPILALDKVRYVGDHVAMVVAETLEQAKNAAELVDVDYEVLSAVVNVTKAAKAAALHDAAPDNHCYHWALGDKAQVDAAFAGAAHVTKLDLTNNRLIPNAMEPRAAIGHYADARHHSHQLARAERHPHPAPDHAGMRRPARRRGVIEPLGQGQRQRNLNGRRIQLGRGATGQRQGGGRIGTGHRSSVAARPRPGSDREHACGSLGANLNSG